MTEADEQLSRMFRADSTPDRDLAFADQVEIRLRRARAMLRLSYWMKAVAFVGLSVGAYIAWRAVAPLIGQISPFPDVDILGAPAPALVLLALGGAVYIARRFFRELA